MKKLAGFAAVVLLIGAGILLLVSRNDDTENPFDPALFVENVLGDRLFGRDLVLTGEGEAQEFTDLEDLEAQADVIVVAEKIAQGNPTVIFDDHGVSDNAYTPSVVVIREVIRGDDLISGERLTILENEAYDEERAVITHVSGYEMMLIGNEYLLFLEDSDTTFFYSVTGFNYGKVPLDEERSQLRLNVEDVDTPEAEELLERFDHQETIRDQAREKYADYINE